MNASLEILFEDYHCLGVSKPAPLLTQAPAGVPSLEFMIKDYIKEKYAKPGNVYLGVPHRLDRPVSGVVVFARNTKAARNISEQFQQHRVRKVYWAIVEGSPSDEQGTWTDFIRKVPDEARAEIVASDADGAKEAILDYRVLQRLKKNATLIELAPRTGRMHQLRLQSAHRGLPVVGDELYGSSRSFGPIAELARDRIIALHARSLTFYHPIRREEAITVTAPLSEAWNGWDISDASG